MRSTTWKRQLFVQRPKLQVCQTSPTLFDGAIIANTKLLEWVWVSPRQIPSVKTLTKLGNDKENATNSYMLFTNMN